MKKEYLKKSQVKFTFNVTIEEYNLAKESFKNENIGNCGFGDFNPWDPLCDPMGISWFSDRELIFD